jgi:hypothetical protein
MAMDNKYVNIFEFVENKLIQNDNTATKTDKFPFRIRYE